MMLHRVWTTLLAGCLLLVVGCGSELGPAASDSLSAGDSALTSRVNQCSHVVEICTQRINTLTETIERLNNTLSDPSSHPGIANLKDREAQLKVECDEKITEACG